MGSFSIYFTFNFAFESICTREDERTGNPINFIPEAEDEVIREAISHKLDRPLVNPLNRFLMDSTQTKTPNSTFHISDFLR